MHPKFVVAENLEISPFLVYEKRLCLNIFSMLYHLNNLILEDWKLILEIFLAHILSCRSVDNV